MGEIIAWVKQIFILSILSNIILHIMPSSQYKQYAKFVCGIIITIVCLSPFISFINGDITFDNIYKSIINDQQLDDFKIELNSVPKDNKMEVILIYEKQLETQIEEKLLEMDMYPSYIKVSINSDESSENYAKLESISIKLSTTKEAKKDITINDIVIEDININNKAKDNIKKNEEKSSTINNVKDFLSDFYNLDKENINININGE